jgi:hypothetical protein
MGYMRHNAILVTAYDERFIEEAREQALRTVPSTAFKGLVSGPVASTTNGYVSFLLAPDGSKEGWNTSEQGDTWRAEFIRWLQAREFDDGSSVFSWVEVQYGDDDGMTRIVADSDAYKRTEV